MASSSVSQEDIDNDFEKNSRRSRIRTARARQINPSSGSTVAPSGVSVPQLVAVEDEDLDPAAAGDAGVSASKLFLESPGNAVEDASPKAAVRSAKDLGVAGAGKRPNKLHHVNKGKQQRDRRKLREKRRSTGVVHLASTESTTGGSTTGDDDESSDAAQGGATASSAGANPATAVLGSCTLSAETKRNTQLNESLIHHGHHHHHYYHQNPSVGSPAQSCSHHHHPYHHRSAAASSSLTNSGPSGLGSPLSRAGHGLRRREKSPSDLEADDENDHDSLNQSESSSNFSSSNHIPGLASSSNEHLQLIPQQNSCNVTTSQPSERKREDAYTSESGHSEQMERIIEENRRLHSLMEEKDKKISLLEFRIQQIMKDSVSKSEEQLRLQKENTTLLRALSNITAAKKQQQD